jgi:uncharacterized phosphosugar-binding protein
MIHERLDRRLKEGRRAEIILSRYAPTARDVILIFSNSGVNILPVEMAMVAKTVGMKVIAVISSAYASQAPLSSLGKRLAEVADIVIDNGTPPGDALVELELTGLRSSPASTIAGAYILNSVLTEAVWRLAASGQTPITSVRTCPSRA